MKTTVTLLILASLALPLRAAEVLFGPTGVVRQIEVVIKRTDPAVIRRQLAFREGDLFTADKVEESRKNLHRLGLFKTLDIEAKWDAVLDGYKVTVKADDGWFFLPVPMFGSRGGQTFAMLSLMEMNYFRRSEGILCSGAYSTEGGSGNVSFFLPRFAVMAGGQRSERDQYQYADGAYNAKQFDSDMEREKAEDFGTVTNQYKQDSDKFYFYVSDRVTPWMRATAGCAFNSVNYRNATYGTPADAGNINAWNVSLKVGKEGRGDAAAAGGFLGSFGRIFGLGMAGVKDSLKPLPRIESTPSLQVAFERGEPWLGSDADYSKVTAVADCVTLFRDRSKFTVAVKGGWGDRLPSSQLLATGQRGFLSGVYAREFRGDTIAAGAASFSKSFFRNMVGMLGTEVFTEYVVCHGDAGQNEKEGAGFNLAYRFWRVPLPLGGGATYCFDDDNWQFSFAVGGSF